MSPTTADILNPNDLPTLIRPESIARLQQGFTDARMLTAAQASLVGSYQEVSGYVRGAVGVLAESGPNPSARATGS